MKAVLIVALVLAAGGLAGCAEQGPDPDPDADPTSTPVRDAPPLEGWVFDAAVRPVAGVTIVALEQDQQTETDADGHYEFEALPLGASIIIAASHAGYEPQSKQVTLHPDLQSRVNFTLARVPEKTPFMEVVPFEGFLACQISVVVAEDEVFEDCGGEGTSQDTFRFDAGADLAGVVVEIAWTPGHQLADSLYAELRTGSGEVIADVVGQPILRLQVPEAFARSAFEAGGTLEVFVRVMPNTDEEEAATGIGLVVNQDFEAFASLFYVEPPDPSYTVG